MSQFYFTLFINLILSLNLNIDYILYFYFTYHLTFSFYYFTYYFIIIIIIFYFFLFFLCLFISYLSSHLPLPIHILSHTSPISWTTYLSSSHHFQKHLSLVSFSLFSLFSRPPIPHLPLTTPSSLWVVTIAIIGNVTPTPLPATNDPLPFLLFLTSPIFPYYYYYLLFIFLNSPFSFSLQFTANLSHLSIMVSKKKE